MHDLTAITALGGTEPRVDTVASVKLTEVVDLALASVTARLGQEEKCRKVLAKLLDADVPGPGKAQLHFPETAVWMGPDQWMIGAPFDTHEDIADQLKERFKSAASITEQTDAWCCFDLQGDGFDAVMELLCNVDIRRMALGDAVRTSIHHLGCFVLRGDADWVRILGPRSSAGSLHHALVTAMKSAL